MKVQKFEFLWKDENRKNVEYVKSDNGRYIMGCDPISIPTRWQRFWMKFGFYKKGSHCGTLRIDKDGSWYKVK